jgi:hypothetical protein
VSDIEKWLRVTYDDESKFRVLHTHRGDIIQGNPYKKALFAPCDKGMELMDSKEFLPWIAGLFLTCFGGLIYGLFFFVPAWVYLFGIKQFLMLLRFVSIWLSYLTPAFIFAFLVYSPICKQIIDPSASLPS